MPPPHGHMTEEELLRQQQLRPPMPPPPPPPTGHIGPPDEASIRQGMLGLIYQAPLNVDILKRPEAQSLQTVIEQGQVHPNVLLHQVGFINIHSTRTVIRFDCNLVLLVLLRLSS